MKVPLHTNSLIEETSPYLLQHAHNPVLWYALRDSVLKKAMAEDKLMVISIGYSACHWCHVMERECFDDEEVAMVMNDHYISVKVDKEERPDVDQQYMNAVRIITGNGGWPLNVICLPDGRPIFGGTFFPKQQWIDILEKVSELYHSDKKRLERMAGDLADGVRNMDLIKERSQGLDYLPKFLRLIVEPWKRKFDTQWGGTQSTPKFPMPSSIEFLLSYAYHMRDESVMKQVVLTLDRICQGGIYDHVGGGFHRYSTDAQWFMPHFEKMLYDNALLALVYMYGYQHTKSHEYRQISVNTLEFLLREFYSEDNLFCCSMDADSVGGEGSYYLWTYSEIWSVLDGDAGLFCDRFGVLRNGNVECNENILSVSMSIEELSAKYAMPKKLVQDRLDLSLKKLFCYRSLREKPRVDTKQILSWNALAVKSFALASAVFDEPRYLVVAAECISQIEQSLMSNGKLLRAKYAPNKEIAGMLDDYAFLIDAYVALYSVTFNFKYLNKAQKLVEVCLTDFYDEASGMFFYTSSDVELPLGRKMDLVDGVTPSSNSSLARSLYYLSVALSNTEYKRIAVQMLSNMQNQMSGAGPFIANWGLLLINLTFAPAEVTLVGADAIALKHELDREYLPNVLFWGSTRPSDALIFRNRWKEGETSIYLCTDNLCRDFTGSINDLKENALELRKCYVL
jgi:uncharacterized protein YyaL (SSP411 family)